MFLGLLDAALDLADRIEILVDPGTIAGAEFSLEAGHVFRDPVQNAAVLPQLGAPLFGAATVAEQPLENDTGIGFGRKRRRGRRPRQIVHVGACKAVVAVADLSNDLRSKLERRDRRILAQLPGRYLIDRRGQLVIAAFRPLCISSAQKCCVGRRVVARSVRVPELCVCKNGDLIQKWHERCQCGRELRDSTYAFGCPLRDVCAHRNVDKTQPAHRTG